MAKGHTSGNGGTPHDDDGVEIAGDEVARYSSEEDHTQIISKITVAECGGNPSAAKAFNQRVPVLAVYGRAVGIKTVDDPNSDKTFTALTGAFNAVNLQTNQEFASGTLYLPDAFQSMIVAELDAQAEQGSKRGMKAFGGVEFAYQIDAKPSANPSGYSYVLRSLLPPKKADPLAHLRERTQLMLAKPVETKALPAA